MINANGYLVSIFSSPYIHICAVHTKVICSVCLQLYAEYEAVGPLTTMIPPLLIFFFADFFDRGEKCGLNTGEGDQILILNGQAALPSLCSC